MLQELVELYLLGLGELGVQSLRKEPGILLKLRIEVEIQDMGQRLAGFLEFASRLLHGLPRLGGAARFFGGSSPASMASLTSV